MNNWLDYFYAFMLGAALLLAMLLCLTSGVLTATAEAPEHLVVAYLTLGVTPPDLKKVEDAVNEKTIPEINVEVEFKAVSAYDAFVLFFSRDADAFIPDL